MALVGVWLHSTLVTNTAENKGMAWPQLLESTSHLWGAKRLELCISEPYIERNAIASKLVIVNYYNYHSI